MLANSKYLFILLFCCACATHKTHLPSDYNPQVQTSEQLEYSVLFFGGADKSEKNDAPILAMLGEQMAAVDKGSLVLLGNNGAKRGLTDSTNASIRLKTEIILRRKLSMLSEFKGDVYIIPGNHDWDDGGKAGYSRVLLLQEYVEEILDREQEVVVPVDACPGPYEVHVSEELVLIFLNTQWWLHEWDKPGPGAICDMEDELDFIVQLDDVIKRNTHKKVIVAGHHPLFSNGPHGGYFPAYVHVLPPVLGSLYAWYRKHIGGLQDLADTKYKVMRNGLLRIFEQHPNLVYLSGHEKSLQYHQKGGQHYIVSGAIVKSTPVVKGNGATFASGMPGFGRINFYGNGDVFFGILGARARSS